MRQYTSSISRYYLLCLCLQIVCGLDLEIFSRIKERVNRGQRNIIAKQRILI